MTDEQFAHQLNAWLDPLVLLQCVHRFRTERTKALAPAQLIITSGGLSRGDEGNYSQMVRKFLSGFCMPSPLMELLRQFDEHQDASDEAWRWLTKLSLADNAHVCSRDNIPKGFPPYTILIVEERDAVVDFLRAPILALLDLVERLAIVWREWADVGGPMYHNPNMPNPFYSYIDSQVGSAFVSFTLQPSVGPKFRYRAVTVCGHANSTDPIWSVVQDCARQIAASTHEPI